MQFTIYELLFLKRDNTGHVSFFSCSPVPTLQCTHIRYNTTYSVHKSLLNGEIDNQLHTSRARTFQAECITSLCGQIRSEQNCVFVPV
jgi:hypothetical protein